MSEQKPSFSTLRPSEPKDLQGRITAYPNVTDEQAAALDPAKPMWRMDNATLSQWSKQLNIKRSWTLYQKLEFLILFNKADSHSGFILESAERRADELIQDIYKEYGVR